MLENALKAGMSVKLDATTPADGNCFYFAIVQQMKRPELRSHIRKELIDIDHHSLRTSVEKYIRAIESCCTWIQNYKMLRENKNIAWGKYLSHQGTTGISADQLFIKATAAFIGIDIGVNSASCTKKEPLNIIPHHWLEPGEGNALNDRPHLVIGHHSDHFQSLSN